MLKPIAIDAHARRQHHLAAARKRLLDRARQTSQADLERQRRAIRDAGNLIEMIVNTYHPRRIYQWGSLLREGSVKDYSDIDIAIEGITDAEQFFRLLGEAQAMTSFPVDIVQMEKIAQEHADDIRRNGRLVYEQR